MSLKDHKGAVAINLHGKDPISCSVEPCTNPAEWCIQERHVAEGPLTSTNYCDAHYRSEPHGGLIFGFIDPNTEIVP